MISGGTSSAAEASSSTEERQSPDPLVEEDRQSPDPLVEEDILELQQEERIAKPRSPKEEEGQRPEIQEVDDEERNIQLLHQETGHIREASQVSLEQGIARSPDIEAINISIHDDAQPNLTDETEIKKITILQTMYLALMAIPFTVMCSFESIIKEVKKPSTLIRSVDLIYHPGRLPLTFYIIAVCTLMYILGMGMAFITMRSLTRGWTVSSRYMMSFTVSCATVLYALLVVNHMSDISLSINDLSRKVSSIYALLLFVIFWLFVCFFGYVFTLIFIRIRQDLSFSIW